MAAEPQRKRCLYEILGVSRDCSPEEIRSAYRRLALQLHPDKVAASGAVSAVEATAAFQELLHAYEVLSDPKERAWYDSHRSQILFSDPSAASKSHKPGAFFDIDLFAFFSKSAFYGFSDTGKGFYKVYGDLFAKVYAQELWFAKEMGLRADAVSPAPLIGNLDSPYSQVTAFYNYWLGFSTVMDFAWEDEYDAAMGPNRRSRRAMEEENKKIRKKARREYNDSVRGLAAFAKKRDKRVVDMMMKKNLEEEKRRAEEKIRKKEEERKKMERARAYEEPEWARIDEREDDVFAESDDDDKKGKEEFYCVVCNKKFKSNKQWKNHEQSKKHRDKVAELRITFQEEDDAVLEDDTDIGEKVHVGFDYEPPESEDSTLEDELCEKFRDDIELDENEVEGENLEEKDDEASILEAMVSGHKNRMNDFDQHDSILSSDHHPDNDDLLSSMEYGTRRRGRRNQASSEGTNEPETEVAREETGENQGEEREVQNQDQSAEDSKETLVEDTAGKGKGGGKSQKSKRQQAEKKASGKKNAAASVPDFKDSSKGQKQKVKHLHLEICLAATPVLPSQYVLVGQIGNNGD